MDCLAKADYFAFNGRPRHVVGSQSSVFGVVGTFLLLLAVGGYVATSTYAFFTNPPQTSMAQHPTQSQRHAMVPTCISLPKITDARYFAYRLQLVRLDARGRTVLPNVELNLTTRVDNASDTVCIDTSDPRAFLRSTCDPGDCAYLKFKLWTCGCPDAANPERDRVDCASLDDIDRVLDVNYVNVVYQTALGRNVLHAAPKLFASVLYTSAFALNETRVNPDLVRQFRTEERSELVHNRDSYAVQYFFDAAPFKEILEVRMIMSAHTLLTSENRMTSLDLIGSWGAFFGVISSTLALVFTAHNEKRFFERNPKWTQIDGDFAVAGSAANSGATKAAAPADDDPYMALAYGHLT